MIHHGTPTIAAMEKETQELSCHNSGEDASSCSGTARNSSTTGPHLVSVTFF